MREISLSLIGFGNVGKGVAGVVLNKQQYFREKYGLEIKVVSITDSTATIWDPNGIDLKEALEIKKSAGSLKFWGNEYEIYELKPSEVVKEVDSDVVVDVTNDKNAAEWHLEALKNEKAVVTSNKPPVVFRYGELIKVSSKKDVPYLFEATVMAGTPIIHLLKSALPADSIERIWGVLNGTTTFILNAMEDGMGFEEALKKAQELGIAERDPSNDIEGIDAGYKGVILHNVAFHQFDFKKAHIEGIEGISEKKIRENFKRGTVTRLVALVEDGRVEIKPRELPINSPLAVRGTSNVALIESDLLGELVIKGAGAGIKETASGVVSDIIRASLKTKYL
ncbi:MAG: homoserine dehydrogenase [Thermococcaceae archaeon]|jgi:homoserine dehydrogenase|uniref:homoserine dehydrogenase n=1 Tax=Thermococcus TaxID=2263 RepID=UPI0005B2E1DA|nr:MULTISPECIES: homoserine dehydrogenase [Thermococcus]MDK2784037.1 homoserine dehydrogenase [Thermococcaceae archaeon]MCA6214001.1 homoserine dehydrogenase [Thermococcus bergensis]MDK2984224.1 homoserine dehydrogenase [Thermococcaceae archaeon]MDN5321495.1 homoserine dehydrogenase [Thermococcaceae archaeon]MPW38364.1 homoserine dehydrogenase [Thermococcus sp. 101 C5]